MSFGVLGLPSGGARLMALGVPPRTANGYARMFRPGSYTFTAPGRGDYKFVMWGPGGAANGVSGPASAASGAYCERTVRLNTLAEVAIVVGAGGSATDTTVTLPGYVSNNVLTAGAANGATPGTASNGDLNLDGSAPGVAGAGAGGGTSGAGRGAGAPGTADFPGGNGEDGTGAGHNTPGGGGDANGVSTAVNGLGGDGLVFVFLEKILF